MKKNSSKREYKDYILDIYNSIEEIEKFVEGFSFEEFQNDKKTIYAVVRAIEIIGEATKNVPTSIKKINSEIKWAKVKGMRNKLIHEYFGVNIKVVWKTIKEDIPELKEKMAGLLKELKINKLV
ncbi:MAG: DUF86 domain-containing protein [Candidatus Staskawiczbacteria bacterium]|nr:DUF86 domain-containing protein [Candidatus Staskawiczbacteria bacterium]